MKPLNPGQVVENLKTDLGGTIEQSYVDVSSDANGGQFETFKVTFLAEDEHAQGQYFSFECPDGEKAAVWLNINEDDTPPSGAIYTAADSKVPVEVPTASTAIEIAALAKTAIEADLDLAQYDITDNLDGSLTFVANALGVCVNAAPHAADDDGAGAIEVEQIAEGADCNIQSTYFQIRDNDTGLFHVWMNANDEGVDPDPGSGSVGIEIALATPSTPAQIAAAIAAAIEADAEFEASSSGSRVQISTVSKTPVTDLVDGDSGFAVSVQSQGTTERFSPGGSPADISNNPSKF